MSSLSKYEELKTQGSFYKYWGSKEEDAAAAEAIKRWLAEPSETTRYLVAATSQHHDATLYIDRASGNCHPIYEVLVATREARPISHEEQHTHAE